MEAVHEARQVEGLVGAGALQGVEVEQGDALVDGEVPVLLEAHHHGLGVGLGELGRELVLGVDVGGGGVGGALEGLEVEVRAEGGQEGARGPRRAASREGVRQETAAPGGVHGDGRPCGGEMPSECPPVPGLPEQGEVLRRDGY